MSRVKRGTVTKQRHKRLLKQCKGFFGQRKNVFKRAKETLMRALAFSFVGRKLKKRDYRGLFITRINAACREYGVSYNRFIGALKKLKIELNRKMMAQMAVYDRPAFASLVKLAKTEIS